MNDERSEAGKNYSLKTIIIELREKIYSVI